MFDTAKRAPNVADLFFASALNLHNNGRLEEAIAAYDAGLRVNPSCVEAHSNRSAALLSLGRWRKAAAAADAALALRPDFAGARSNRATALLQLGHLAEAVADLDVALRARPNVPEAHFSRGVALGALGRLDEAIEALRAAIRLKPNYVEAYNHLGAEQMRAGRPDLALAAYDSALNITPDFVEALSNRGNALASLGRLDEAVASYDAALRVNPDYAEALSNRGAALTDLGRLDEAVASCDAALRTKPDYAEALYNRGNALMGLGRLDEAIAAYEAALRVKTDYTEAVANRAAALADLGRIDEAIDSYDAALRIKPDDTEALCNRGAALTELGRIDEAIASYDAALHVRPHDVGALVHRGSALIYLGRVEEAIASYYAALRIRPDCAEAYYNLSQIKTFVSDDPYLATMESRYRDCAISDVERYNICFALGKAYEDLGRYAEAFDRYAEGNALRKRALGYSIGEDQTLFGALRGLFGQAGPRPARSAAASCAPRPIFVVGMPRSGTTLAEQILASHSQAYGAGELEAMNMAIRAEFRLDGRGWRFALSEDVLAGIRRRYLASLAGLKTSRPVVIDKMPLNFRWLGFILEAIPEARVVNLVRNPVAVCWSIFKIYFPASRLGFAYDLADLAAYYRLHQDLMAFWRELYPGRIFDLNYERLTEDQEGQTRALLDYCGLPWEDGCLDFHLNVRTVRTASAGQVRRKMYRGSSAAWKIFEAQLRPLIEALDVVGEATATPEAVPSPAFS